MRDVQLGDEVEDLITGFTGIAVSKIEHLFGGVEFKIHQRCLNGDDRPMEPIWMEAGRLEVKKKSIAFDDEGCRITEEELREARKS